MAVKTSLVMCDIEYLIWVRSTVASLYSGFQPDPAGIVPSSHDVILDSTHIASLATYQDA